MQGIRYYFNNINGAIEIKKCDNSVHSSKAHFHNEVSLGVVEKGSCKTEINGKNYELNEKTILIIPPALAHKCHPKDYKQWKFRMLYINSEWFQTAFNQENFQIKFSYKQVNEEIFLGINTLFQSIENNAMNIENESKLLKCISMLVEVEDINYEEETLAALSLEKINAIKKYLDENYLNNIMLSDLAKVAGISKYYLIRQFEESQGLSPHKYITNLRINYAKKLLKHNKNFADIALESGFYDQSHFTKCFKEYTGVTPRKYKNYV